MEQLTGYSIYLAYADDCLRQRGFDGNAIFRAAGIGDASHIGFGQRLPEDILAHAFRRLYNHPDLAAFFLELGAAVPVTAHGNLGLAFMACDTAHQAMELFSRFVAIALPGVRADISDQGQDTVLRIHASARYPEFSSALAEALLVNLLVSAQSLTGKTIVPKAASLMQREPPYADQFQRWIPAPITFNADCQSITFRRQDMEAKVLTGNPINLRLLITQCEKELREVQTRTRLADRVREMLALNVADNPSIEAVAKQLSLSERTLRRRLRDEGESFRDLLKGVRHDLALHYLRDTDARIEQIAQRLGYRDAACFRQAFKGMEGVSPREWSRVGRRE